MTSIDRQWLNIEKQWIVALILTVFMFGCGSAANRWNGDLDAVFAYRPNDGVTTVKEVLPGSRCSFAGLKEGDIVLAIDDQKAAGLSVRQVMTALRGPTGSYAIISIQRDSEIINFSIERMPLGSKKKRK